MRAGDAVVCERVGVDAVLCKRGGRRGGSGVCAAAAAAARAEQLRWLVSSGRLGVWRAAARAVGPPALAHRSPATIQQPSTLQRVGPDVLVLILQCLSVQCKLTGRLSPEPRLPSAACARLPLRLSRWRRLTDARRLSHRQW